MMVGVVHESVPVTVTGPVVADVSDQVTPDGAGKRLEAMNDWAVIGLTRRNPVKASSVSAERPVTRDVALICSLVEA